VGLIVLKGRLAYDTVYFDVHHQFLFDGTCCLHWRGGARALRMCTAGPSDTLVPVFHSTLCHICEARKPDTADLHCRLKCSAYNRHVVYINRIVCRIVSEHPQRDFNKKIRENNKQIM
jgi:hypothetical protein